MNIMPYNSRKIVLNIIAVISAVICVTAIKAACGQK